jgi:DNA-binding GntR family transcriptional regulator
LREALSRLAESRLVIAVGHRGFRVPDVSPEDLMDVAMVRRQMEGFALRLAIRYGDDLWEARAVDAGEKFAMLQRSGKNFPENVWESRHRDFHYALITACQSPCLLHLFGALSDQFDRYRRLSAKSRLPNAPQWLVHKEILQATLARDADKAVKLLEDHITEAARLMVVGLLARADEQSAPVQQRKAGAKRNRLLS